MTARNTIRTIMVSSYNRGGMKAKRSGFSWVYRLTTGCKNNTENWATDSGESQLHKAKMDQRRCCTVNLRCSAGSPFGTCVAVQVAFAAAALMRQLSSLSDSGSQFAQKSMVFGQIRGYQSSIH